MADYTNGVYLSLLDTLSKQITAVYLLHPNAVEAYSSMQNRFPDDTSVGLDDGTAALQLYFPQKSGATDTVIFENHHIPVESDIVRKQSIGMSGGNEPSIYDSGEEDKLYTINVMNVDEAKMERFQIFIANICKFALYEFELEDQSNVVYTCRYWGNQLPRIMKHDLLYDIRFTVWVSGIEE